MRGLKALDDIALGTGDIRLKPTCHIEVFIDQARKVMQFEFVGDIQPALVADLVVSTSVVGKSSLDGLDALPDVVREL